MNGIDFPDEYLASMWNNLDWAAVEEKLSNWQKQLSIAAAIRDEKKIIRLQKKIVRDTDIKCLAVRHVCASTSSPGIDGIRWRTSAQKMRAAISLTSKDYHASPLRQIILIAKNTGKERRAGLPTYYDRAMNVLYGYSLLPVTESIAERKSFAFRPGRSTQDAHSYVLEALKGKQAPQFVVCADIKAYYAHIQHSWLLEHVPMDKGVLSEFLNAGIVFAGELFPADGEGISEGCNISPYLGNFVLDGLQKYLYQKLHGTTSPKDYADGNLIRFADDVLITVRKKETGEKVLEILRGFMEERGLALSPDKTKVCSIDEGFTFLSRTYIRRSGLIYSYPSDKAIDRFINALRITILTNKRSQRELIITLNKKLQGWASYHRYCDAGDAFRKVDAAVQAALLEAAVEKHPKMAKAKILAKYWYKEPDGRHCYALQDDKSIRVLRLSDTLLLIHNKIKTNANPFVELEYVESRDHKKAIQNVTGPYKAVWKRQNGRCHYCGRPILADQARTVVPFDLRRPPSVRNSTYIHDQCKNNEFEMVRTMEDVGAMRPYEVLQAIEGVKKKWTGQEETKTLPNEQWRHMPLKQYFEKQTGSSVTLAFRQIEKIEGNPLPPSARKSRAWWVPRADRNTIAEAWLSEGYELHRLNLGKETVTLHRNEAGVSKLEIPEVLIQGRIPDDAKFELEQHMAYIIVKYGL